MSRRRNTEQQIAASLKAVLHLIASGVSVRKALKKERVSWDVIKLRIDRDLDFEQAYSFARLAGEFANWAEEDDVFSVELKDIHACALELSNTRLNTYIEEETR